MEYFKLIRPVAFFCGWGKAGKVFPSGTLVLRDEKSYYRIVGDEEWVRSTLAGLAVSWDLSPLEQLAAQTSN